jgi:hypothetical protein
MDMLEVGRNLSVEEDKTHFGMWCIMSSPLLIGCDMSNINTTALNLLKNKDLIALNQDPLHLQAYVCQTENDCYVLVKDIEERFGLKRAFAVYNPTDEQKTVVVDFAKMDLGGTIELRDCFKRRAAGTAEGTLEVTLPAHGTAIYTATAQERLERTLYEAETGFIGNYQEVENNQALPSGSYDDNASYCSGGMKVGWLGKKDDNYLEWRDVYSFTGGKYRLTLYYVSGESRSAKLSVNGGPSKSLTALNSGGFDRVGKKTTTIQLNAGSNTIRLANATAWMPDIDCITLELLEADGVEEMKDEGVNNEKYNDVIYSLSGQRVDAKPSQLRPGIYIINNKKVRIR